MPDMYHGIMSEIRKQPHVTADLARIAKLGADRERVLSLLAVAVGTKARVSRALIRQAERLEDFAQQIEGLVRRADIELADERNQPSRWIEWLGLEEQTGSCSRFAPNPIQKMLVCASWSRRNAKFFRQLKVALSRTEKKKTIMFLTNYIELSTGACRHAVLARLLNAAHDAVGVEKTYTAGALKKMHQRYPNVVNRANQELADILSD